ncbi:ATP-binding protein [Sphaerimonospora mesophila]|uniref:ATP-binding protein n=1 Tax=Sphaerimonospora mesophila TaxID=37483 RepID=UPI0006E404F4
MTTTAATTTAATTTTATATAATSDAAPGTACPASPDLLGSAVLPGRSISVGIARAFVRDLLRVAECHQVDDALLLVSELVTNAVQHSDSGLHRHGQVSVAVVDAGATIRVDVTDDGSSGAFPMVAEAADLDTERGRGLWLVDRLATRWGAHGSPAGRVVWFEIARRPGCP